MSTAVDPQTRFTPATYQTAPGRSIRQNSSADRFNYTDPNQAKTSFLDKYRTQTPSNEKNNR